MNTRLVRLVAGIKNPDSHEPALKVGGAFTSVVVLFGIINTLFPNLMSDDLEQIILIVAAFFLPFITALFTRHFVWSPASVKELMDEAVNEVNKTVRELKEKDDLIRMRDLRTKKD